MGSKRSKCFSRWRRGFGRAVVFLVAASALVAGGCGHSGDGATKSEKAADVEVLNGVLAQELTTIAAYERGLPLLHGPMLTVAGEFRGQDQAHVDALTKAVRGLGGEIDAEASELEPPGPRTGVEALALAYEEENAALAATLDAAPGLQTTAPRALAAALAADHAQHLVVLRRGLGTRLADLVPEPFESGDLPPPTVPATGAQP